MCGGVSSLSMTGTSNDRVDVRCDAIERNEDLGNVKADLIRLAAIS